jgi:hypothetical protein
MSLLDLQGMESPAPAGGGHGGGGVSSFSLLLCDSNASTLLCL